MDKNLEYPEINITSSWVLLGADEDANVSEGAQIKFVENLATEKNEEITEEIKASFFEEVANTLSDTNKSDAESDGISIISESEFYLNRGDDYYNNSSDEKKEDYFKNADEPLKENANVDDIDNFPHCPFLNTENDDLTQHNMTGSGASKELNASNLTETDSDINNLEPMFDRRTAIKELVDYFKTIFKYNSLYLISTILLAITMSYISSKITQYGSVHETNIKNYDSNVESKSRIVNTHIDKYTEDIFDCSSFNHDQTEEKCVMRPIEDIRQAKKLKPPEKIIYSTEKPRNLDPSTAKSEIIPSEYYTENDEKGGVIYESNTKVRHSNKNSEDIWKLENNEGKYYNQKKYTEITKEKLLLEKENIEYWRRTLAKKEKRLKEWEKKLLVRERKLFEEKKNRDNSYASSEIEKKSKKFKNEEKLKKTDDLRTKKSFQDKKVFKKDRSGAKKINAQLNHQNQKPKKMKYKFDEHKRKIPDIYVKFKNLDYVYAYIKRNQSTTFDDNNTITGEWYLNLLQARNDKREKSDKAAWWFERVNFRKIKRNKAYWYFQYMFNREDLRYISSQKLLRNV